MKRAPIKTDLTAEFVRSILSYAPETGLLTWKVDRARTAKAGDVAGCLSGHGYIDVMICGKTYKAHRVIWLIVKGEWPTAFLDHEDGDRANNKWLNLREATHSQNCCNRARRGYFFHKANNRYRASISVDGELKIIGWYWTAEEAKAAYLVAAQENHGKFTHHSVRP